MAYLQINKKINTDNDIFTIKERKKYIKGGNISSMKYNINNNSNIKFYK